MSQINKKLTFLSLSYNLKWNFVGQFFGKASLLIFHIIFAKLAGVEGYGEFSFVFVGGLILLQPGLDLGINQLITKWISRGNKEVINLSFKIKGVTSIILIPLSFIIGWYLNISLLLLVNTIVFFLFNTFQQSIFGILRGLGDLRPESIVIGVQNFLACCFLSIFIFIDYRDTWIGPFVLMITRLLGSIIVLVVFWKKYYNNLKYLKNNEFLLNTSFLWKEAFALGLVIILIQFYFRIDIIMLGLMTSDKEVGFYNTAFNLMEGTFFIPTIVMSAIFPLLSQSKKFFNYFMKGALLLSFSGVFCGLVMFFFADLIIISLFGKDFLNTVEILEKLSLAIPVVFLGYLTTQALVALDQNKIYLIVTICGLVINVILNLALIPKYGGSGAALATVITETLIPLSCFVIILKHHYSQS